MQAMGWEETIPDPHGHAKGTIVGFTAPVRALMAATHLNEWALHSAATDLDLAFDPTSLDDDRLPLERAGALDLLRARVTEEASLPPDELIFSTPPYLPIALVTGSNGKTTTTRILAAILTGAGHTVGSTSTDGVQIGGSLVEKGDWSGPLGAARVLANPTVTAAVLETARGGLLRRGLVVGRASVAIVTNVAEDHFGEYGIDSLEDLARVKGLVARALGPGGTLILNGDDPILSPGGPESGGAPGWMGPVSAEVTRFSLARGWPASLPPMEEMPITAGGRARYNAANALAAAGAAEAMGIPSEIIASTLRRFGEHPDDNPGRLTFLSLGGVDLLLDYAHNPHGLSALLAVARAGTGGRLLVLLGQAGDRDDEAIRELARTAWKARPDRVIVRELEGYARGRPHGEVSGVLARELERLGASPDQLRLEPDEMEAVREALRWARAGDLLVLPIHSDSFRARTLALVESLRDSGWEAGDPIG